ncbi:MAG: hypothetical protein AAFU03_05375, partial [Bacteroidota bacterium]
SMPEPVLTFNQGITNFHYFITDPSGNSDTCSFAISVLDQTPPVAICQPTTIFVDPSGLEPITVDPAAIDGGSLDNCSIDTMSLSPATFDCSQIGTNQDVVLTIVDGSGNMTSCSTIVGVSALEPIPTANSGLCGGDTLFLFANPPTTAAPGQVVYTFRWFNPDDVLFSTEENPFITNIDAGDEGPYRVEITGVTGCVGEGVINVNIEDLPLAPVITAPQSVCIGEPIPLSSPSNFSGTVVYQWFEGEPGFGSLLGESPVPEFMVPGPHGDSGRRFYVVAFVNGCESSPSTAITVTTVTQPLAEVDDPTIFACENGTATLAALTTPNAEYEWTGPNGFMASGQIVDNGPLIPADAGTYYLRTVRNEGCFSEPDSLELTVIAATPPTTLSSNSPVCLGETLMLTAAATNANEYLFMAPNGAEFLLDTNVLVIEQSTLSEQGNWRIIVDNGACPSLPSDPINVTISVPPIAQAITLPDPVCAGNDVILQGSSNISGSTYAWVGPNGFTSELIAPLIEDVVAEDSGEYILTVTGPTGCTDRDSIDLDVLGGLFVAEINIVDETCLSGGETVFLVSNITPPDVDGLYEYEWSGPQGITGQSDTLVIPDISPANSGVYSLTVTDENGCLSPPASFTVDFQFSPATPIAPITADGEEGYCLGEDFTLSTTDFGPGTIYFWQTPEGAVLTSDTNFINLLAFDSTFTGNYRVRVVREGCSSTFSNPTEIIVTDFPNLEQSVSTPVCEGEPIMLQATDLAGATYSWRGPNNFSSSLPNPVITNANPDIHNGTYSVVATIGGCRSDSLFLDVEVLPKPGMPVGVPHSAICIDDTGASLDLSVNANTATPGAIYQWYVENGQVPIGDPTMNLDFTLTDFGLFPTGGLVSFFVQAELNGCFSDLSNALNIQLDIADGDAAMAGNDTTVCEGLYLLQAVEPIVGTGEWELISEVGDVFIANPSSPTTAVSGMTEFGSPYVFVWALSNGECKDYSRDTVVISVTSGESAFAGDDILACIGRDVNLAATPAIEPTSEGEWSQNLAQEILGVVIEEPSNPNTLITGLQPDNVYSFTWTVRSECGINTDVVLVNV